MNEKDKILINLYNVEYPLERFRGYLERLLEVLDLKVNELAITLCDNSLIKELNTKFRNKTDATDVLSFNYLEDDCKSGKSKKIEGEIYISLDFVKENSLEFKVNFEEELFRLSLHGILHLMCFEHETNDFEKEEMLKFQEEILRGILSSL